MPEKMPEKIPNKMPADIMTVPRELDRPALYYLTGNEYLSLPEIDPQTAGIHSLNLLHMGSAGLLEFRGRPGAPLLTPFLKVEGREVPLAKKLAWSYLHHWVPAFTWKEKNLTLKGELYFPPGHRGGVYRLTLTNTGSRTRNLEAGFRLNWQACNHIIFNPREVSGQHATFYNKWTKSLILEARSGLPLAALALGLDAGVPWEISTQPAPRPAPPSATQSTAGPEPQPAPRSAARSATLSTSMSITGTATQQTPRAVALPTAGLIPHPAPQPSPTPLAAARASVSLRLKLGESRTLPLYLAANIEGDGAGTTIVDLRRHGHAALRAETAAWLEERSLRLEEFTSLANRNLFFNYFYAAGRTVDTDQWVPVTSRSPRYYVSAAFWSRDALLWSFPGLLLVSCQTARAILLRIFSAHMERAGEHAHYINGTLLYPGFELDQLSAHAIALDRYIAHSGDEEILQENAVRKGLEVLVAKLYARFDFSTGLFSSFLDPSDDPVQYPFLIYCNALAQVALKCLAAFREKGAFATDIDLAASAASLKENIYRLGRVEGPYGTMFAWSVDGTGSQQVYDNPPGSLQLIAHYGFCSREDLTFRHTCHWVNSPDNPYFHADGPIRGAASRHAKNPWPLGAANDLLAMNLGKGEFFRQARMDNGFCCETVNPKEEGRASTGLAFASAAGFLAYALWKAYGEPHRNKQY